MTLMEYIKDKYFNIIMSIIMILIVFILLLLTDASGIILFIILFIMVMLFLSMFIHDYTKKKSFFNSIKKLLDSLDKKYLITEMISEGNSLESKKLLEYLYEIDRCMHEEINTYKFTTEEFKEYLELWCHEIKTPIATSKLIIENNTNEITKSILEEINKIDSYVEQVLFYERSDAVDKDYIISSFNIKNTINDVIKRNKKALISKKIKISNVTNNNVNSDSKWLEFILNQIVQNSIKYSKENNAVIEFTTKENKNNIILTIEDNGIGINESEIDKIFNKGFTGTNGRMKYNSTGIGLYLCKKLCDKLGLDIKCISKYNKYTKILIVFPLDSVIDEVK